MCICAMCMQMPWEARRVLNALVLELQAVVSRLMLVLGTEPGSFARTAHAFNYGATRQPSLTLGFV